MTKLYLLKRNKGYIGWDENVGFVVRARDSKMARKMAEKNLADEPKGTWLDPHLSKIQLVGISNKTTFAVLLIASTRLRATRINPQSP